MKREYDPREDPTNASYKGPTVPDWPAVMPNSSYSDYCRPTPRQIIPREKPIRNTRLEDKE